MQWDSSDSAGFTTGEPWIAVNPNYLQINADAQVADPESVFAHFRAVIELRHTDPVVAYGDFTMLLPEDPAVDAYTRGLPGSTLLVVANFSAKPVRAGVPDEPVWANAELVLGNYPPSHGRPSVPDEQIQLRPWEARVYRRAG